jgi:hypothetical protein
MRRRLEKAEELADRGAMPLMAKAVRTAFARDVACVKHPRAKATAIATIDGEALPLCDDCRLDQRIARQKAMREAMRGQ